MICMRSRFPLAGNSCCLWETRSFFDPKRTLSVTKKLRWETFFIAITLLTLILIFLHLCPTLLGADFGQHKWSLRGDQSSYQSCCWIQSDYRCRDSELLNVDGTDAWGVRCCSSAVWINRLHSANPVPSTVGNMRCRLESALASFVLLEEPGSVIFSLQ